LTLVLLMKIKNSYILNNHNGAGIIEVLVAAIILSLLMVGLAQLLTTGEEGEEGLRQKQMAGLRIQQEFDEVIHIIKSGSFDTSSWGSTCPESTHCSTKNNCSECSEKGIATRISMEFNSDSTTNGHVYIQVEQNPNINIPGPDNTTIATPQFGYMIRCYIKDSSGIFVSGMVTFVAMPN